MARTKRTRSRQKTKRQLRTDQWYRGCEQTPTANRKTRSGINAGAPAFYRTSRWLGLRSHVLERDQHLCQYCGAHAIQADHITPRSAGGADAVENLVACCTSCNRVAGGRVFKNFEEKKWWLLTTRNIPRKDLVFPVKRERTTPEVINVPEPIILPSPLNHYEHKSLVNQAQTRDDRRCIICKAPSRRVIQLAWQKRLDINNVATMCQGCERAARTIPADEAVTSTKVRSRRAAGM